MRDYLGATTSLCRACGRMVAARVEADDEGVWLHKHCPDHGVQIARVYGDGAAYRDLGRIGRPASVPMAFATTGADGCPDSCGLCPEHEQHVCMPIIEITDCCDLACPICLVGDSGSRHLTRRQVSRMLDGLIESEGQIGVATLSGGEPTLNPEFREIVEECVSRKEILRVSVSTNGLSLARDPDLMRFLADRSVVISLQFDGLRGEVYRALRGRDLSTEKMRVIELAGEIDAPMSLTATVVRGVNEDDLSDVVELLFEREYILSVMFQPMAYAGRGEAIPRPRDAVTIPDVIDAIEGAAGGLVARDNFTPLPCSHPACFSLAFYLRTDPGRFVPIKGLVGVDRYMDIMANRALFGTDAESFEQIQEAVYDLWSGPSGMTPDSQQTLGAVRRLLRAATCGEGYNAGRALAAAERSIKSIFVHQFMDRDTFDLARVRKCCNVYPQPDGKLIPACVNNCIRR